MNCREWVYFDCFLDINAIRKHISFPDFVHDHSHRGTHDGQGMVLFAPAAMMRLLVTTNL